MNWDRLEGSWKELTAKIKQQWAKLTEDEMTEIDRQHDEFAGRSQQSYGIERDEAEQQPKEREKTH